MKLDKTLLLFILAFFITSLATAVLFTYYDMDTSQQSIISSNDGIIYSQQFDSASFNIGDNEFKSTPLMYDKTSCGQVDTRINVGKPSNQCWYTIVSFGGFDYTIHHAEEISLNPYMKVKLNAFGTVYYDTIDGVKLQGDFKRPSDWTNTYIFKFTNESFLFYKFNDINTLIKIKDTKKAVINIKNLFTGFNGGLYVKTYNKKFFTGVRTSYVSFKINKGEQDYATATITSDNLGQTILDVTPYIIINGVKYFENNPIKNIYNIVPNIISIISTNTVCRQNNDCPSNYYCQDYVHNQISLKLCEKDSKRINILQYDDTRFIIQIVLLIIAVIFFIFAVALLVIKANKMRN